ncbi:RNA polymerase II-associated protein 3 isoform X2 [Halyomorpha halys]|uniref:RNA polymerase II-associated protein 3 isoform X2 n=1 Tax=Halyomorpha halys TaxID=286706 RepID=UPI0006D4F6E6|nr:sperm-associated antigen 1 isoform X2 [Halyomorpha halys]
MTTDTLPEKTQTPKKKKSLLEKYEIPINHLDFKYVKKCCNILEIERILRILRSGEEGHYPELLKCVEERLKFLSPDHKALRTCEPVMTKSCLNAEEWNSVHKEIMEWKNEIDETDQILNNSKSVNDSNNYYPEVRRSVKKIENETKKENLDKKKITMTDYNQWEKFDADKECLKLDLEEEKRAEEKQRRELAEKKKKEAESSLSLEEKEIHEIAQTSDALSEEERKVIAAKEKELGNEFYKRNLFNDAIRYYTRSICLYPTAVSYNNRAATYLKQCKFNKAQDDLDIVLEMEPDNVKAHFRRALTRQHKNEFQEALDDILFVLKHEPNHVIAKHIANELRENCYKIPRTHKIRTYDESDPKKIVDIEVTDKEFHEKYKDKKEYLALNDFNLPKIMCNCNGKHTNDPLLCNHDPIRYQHIRARYGERANDKIAEMERASKMLRAAGNRLSAPSKNLVNESVNKAKPLIQPADNNETKPSMAGARRLDIVELEKIEEEEMTSKIQGTHLNVLGDKLESPQKAVTSCLVTDKRKTKPPKVYFGNYEEGDSEEGKQEEAAALVQNIENDDTIPKTKEEKMNMNINLKESLDKGGGGDTVRESTEEPMLVDDSSPSCSTLSVKESLPSLPTKGVAFGDSTTFKHNGTVGYESSSSEGGDELPNEITVDVHSAELMPNVDLNSIAKEFFPNDCLKNCECGEGFILWPSQFESAWHSFEKLPNAVEERSKLLRLICSHRLSAVISNTLDDELLSGLINCLDQHFDPVTEGNKVRSYLESIANLQRFKIIYCFLPKNSKHSVRTLLKKLNPISAELEKDFL